MAFKEQRICVDCGKEFTALSHNSFRCMDCRYKHHLDLMNEKNRERYGTGFVRGPRKCVDCGKEFFSKHSKSIRCPECRKIYTKEQAKELNRKYRTGEAAPKPKKKKDPNICTKPASCAYGGFLGATRICDYLSKVGERRPCPAGECTVYKRKGRGKQKNVLRLDLRS